MNTDTTGTTGSTGSTAPYVSELRPGRGGFAPLLRAELTKFRTVRGWAIGLVVAVLATMGLTLLVHSSCSFNGSDCPSPPVGPDGGAVTDTFYFVHQPLHGDGSITVRMTSLTGLYSENGGSPVGTGPGQNPTAGMKPGLQPWGKAGIIIKDGTAPGSAYAAMMVTGGHGVRMQYDYTHDRPGLAGEVSAASPRWLRLTRSGDTITGYDSADGTHWTKVGAITLAGLPATAQIGLFAASPVHTKVVSQSVTSQTATGGPSQITAVIDKLGLQGAKAGGVWAGGQTGGDGGSVYPVRGGAFRQSGGTLTVTGSGDIAPAVPGGPSSGVSLSDTLVGMFAGLIAMVVVGTVFITSEYRRGLIRTTLTASPRRGRVLAAKAVVIAAVTFVAGLVAVTGALVIGEPQMRAGGVSIDPVSTLTLVRIVAGTAALLAVAAVLALAIGTVLRRSAIAVVAVIVTIVLPYFLAVGGVSFLPVGVANWLLRLTPAAAFAIQQPYPRYAQVDFSYTPQNGYYPLAPWAGFAVLCAWAAVALGLAAFLLRRRDV